MTGDLRAVQNGEKILKEAVKLGFERIVLPVKNADRLKKVAAEVNASRKKAGAAQVKVIGMKNISEMRSLFE